METRIVSLPAMRVIGLAYIGKNEHQEIPALWDVFLPRRGEVQGTVQPEVALGVCGDPREDGSFRYVAGCLVEADAPVPAGMIAIDVPVATYVMVTQRGPLWDAAHGLDAAMTFIHNTWLPQSGYRHAHSPDLEWYDARFHIGQEDSEMDIYTPIEPIQR